MEISFDLNKRHQPLLPSMTSEALLATWDEIDLDGKLWTLSAARMKAGSEHKVPLSAPAIDLIAALPRTGDYLFPGVKAPTRWPCKMAHSPGALRHSSPEYSNARSSIAIEIGRWLSLC